MTNTADRAVATVFALPEGISTPALVVDIDRVDRNIRRMAEAVATRGIDLRPHIKTHKSVLVARRQLAAGAAGITVGTLGEAEVMAAAGIDDIFIAYTVIPDGSKAARLRALHEAIRLRVGVDSVAGARSVAAAVAGCRRPLEVLVEVDSGELRTGVASPAAAAPVGVAARDLGLDVIGVFTHGGHGYASRSVAVTAAGDEVHCLGAAAAALRAEGIDARVLSAGSTPTAGYTPGDGSVTELRPGTYVYGDRQQLALGSIPLDGVAMVVAATVVSVEQPGWVALDAGAKAIGREPRTDVAGLASVPALGDAPVLRAFDYHGLAQLPEGFEAPPVGTVVAVVPNHACPVVNLASEVTFVSGGRVVEVQPIDARGRNG
jgi:D-serine deaminase-like pyridoxal phosphate-dependent protein